MSDVSHCDFVILTVILRPNPLLEYSESVTLHCIPHVVLVLLRELPPPKDESKRQLKGIMKVGLFGRGLLLRGEMKLELVVMCQCKPLMVL